MAPMESLQIEMIFYDNKPVLVAGAIASQFGCPHSPQELKLLRFTLSDRIIWFLPSTAVLTCSVHSCSHGEEKASSHIGNPVTDLSQYLNSGSGIQDSISNNKIMRRGWAMQWQQWRVKTLKAEKYKRSVRPWPVGSVGQSIVPSCAPKGCGSMPGRGGVGGSGNQ